VLFVELAYDLLRDGGVCGLIVPNKIGSADYAAACRRLLLERAEILEITDLSDTRAFPGAGVYPYLMLWRKRVATAGHQVRVGHVGRIEELAAGGPNTIMPQATWQAETGFHLLGTLDVESRVPTIRLGECAHLESGTTGFRAVRVADQLLEAAVARQLGLKADDWFRFVVSGNIDRYVCRTGPVRFLNRRFDHAVLPRDCDAISAAKRRLFECEKIVVAGLTRRIEAARDPGGLALGVQVYAVVPHELPVSYLLALLNSKLLSYLLRRRFPAKRLGGGYLSINKGQLGRLPIRCIREGHAGDRHMLQQLSERAERLEAAQRRLHTRGGIPQAENQALKRAEREVDECVYALYALSDPEIDRVESGFT
jgi:hypothetical protein